MNKAFTLIELIGVLILISVISLITIPAIDSSIKKNKQQLYETQIKNITEYAQNWASKNTSLLPDSGSISLTLGQLKQDGFADEDVKNPITKLLFSNETIIEIKSVNGGYSYKVLEETIKDESLNDYNDKTPKLFLKGDYITYVELNKEVYKEAGFTARNNSDVDITNLVTTSINKPIDNKVNNSSYTITYNIVDNGYKNMAKRTVIVRDTTKPVLVLPSSKKITISEAKVINLLEGVSVTDNSNENIQIKVNGFDTLKGEKIVTYTACDSSNNCLSEKRIITVVDDPIIAFTFKNFDYTGAAQEFIVPRTGNYKLETWGASGGLMGGLGGYSRGNIILEQGKKIYIYVGGQGQKNNTRYGSGGYNGGGSTNNNNSINDNYGGGGATDIRFVEGTLTVLASDSNVYTSYVGGIDSLKSRVIVAGGGSGFGTGNGTANHGGGINGMGSYGGLVNGVVTRNITCCGGYDSGHTFANFGYGGYTTSINTMAHIVGGGGGWYGGNFGSNDEASGGSGFIWTSSNINNVPSGYSVTSKYYLTEAVTTAGNSSMPTHDGVSTMTGNRGNGYAKITFLN
ncbi:MAG: glycine-rich protein [Bacilli bacterium]